MKIIKNIVFTLCLVAILSGGVVFAFGRGNPFSQNNNISDLMPTNVTIEGTVFQEDDSYHVQSEFNVKLTDYNIKVPKLMFMKLNEIIRLEIEFYAKEIKK